MLAQCFCLSTPADKHQPIRSLHFQLMNRRVPVSSMEIEAEGSLGNELRLQ